MPHPAGIVCAADHSWTGTTDVNISVSRIHFEAYLRR
jgi:hypothetical protein